MLYKIAFDIVCYAGQGRKDMSGSISFPFVRIKIYLIHTYQLDQSSSMSKSMKLEIWINLFWKIILGEELNST